MNEGMKILPLVSVLLVIGFIMYSTNNTTGEYMYVEYSGFVTDKWIEESMMLSFSNTDYILEINDEFTKEVTHFDYRNIEIGDIYYYTEWEYV